MDTILMQVDSTHITINTKENPFTAYGKTIVGNITTYNNSDEEEEEEKKKQAKEKRKEE